MLLIVAQRNDLAARSLAERWRSRGAALLTARDLSVPGWKFDMPAQGPSRLIADGRAFTSSQIAGVLTRLAAVPEAELDHVAAEDRSYVSAEMTAFLLAWLSSLKCPVLNRATPSGLCGPGWRIEQWLHLAAGLGIPVKSIRRSTSLPLPLRKRKAEFPLRLWAGNAWALSIPRWWITPAAWPQPRTWTCWKSDTPAPGRTPGCKQYPSGPMSHGPKSPAALLHLFDSRAPC